MITLIAQSSRAHETTVYEIMKAKRQSYKTGSFVAIPLPDGTFAFVRACKDSSFAVYDLSSRDLLPIEEVVRHPILFYQASTDSAIRAGDWQVIGYEPFHDEDSAWPPPQATMYNKDTKRWTMGGIPRVTYRGETLEATIDDVQGMDVASVCNHPDQFIRILKDRLLDRNNDKYKVRPQ